MKNNENNSQKQKHAEEGRDKAQTNNQQGTSSEDNPGHQRTPEWDKDQQERDQRKDEEDDQVVNWAPTGQMIIGLKKEEGLKPLNEQGTLSFVN